MGQSLKEKDIASSLHPFTNLRAHKENGPHIISRGEGIYVWDDEGKKMLEGMSGLWCASLGFSEQRLVDAATRQLQTMPYTHLFSHRANEPAIELADELIRIAPGDLTRAYFVNSGSEAVDTAIKIAWYYFNAIGKPTKKKFIARKRAYHGVTIAGGSLTGLPYVQEGFDLPAIDVIHTETPHHYRYAKENETELEFSTRIVEILEQEILDAGPENIAAYIAEPVMGAGGVLIPPEGYFEKIQALLKKYDILFIADEVICGFARTGNMWGSQTYGINPDILTCAKQLSSAYVPIGAVLINNKVYEPLEQYSDQLGMFGTGNTYGGHPVCAAVALETLRIYEERNIVDTVNARSERFAQRIAALGNHPLVGHSRSVGLIGAIEIVQDKSTKGQFPVADKVAAKVMAAAREHGILVRATPGDGVAFCPPLIIEDDQIDELFDGIQLALDDVRRAMSA
ncbi:MAG: aminotransferase class III-fold pyridoxal phosphate-dependent enzyme [Granulosicoccus sp.]|nr:aminotransferase class III-fold pyridoxal phosphate-dependent enzyme [Granulosicoccus sp.]